MGRVAQILETIGAVREQLNPALAVYGVLLTMVDLKKQHSQRVVATVRHSLKGQVPVFETEIVQHVASASNAINRQCLSAIVILASV